jgi:hypothetical protein
VDTKAPQRPATTPKSTTSDPVPDRNAPAGGKPRVERRSGMDRRRVNLGPPAGTKERRINLESRKPEVQEVTLSASDWVRFDAAVPLKPKDPADPDKR